MLFRIRLLLVAFVLLLMVSAAVHWSTPQSSVDVSQAVPAAFKADDERLAQAQLDQRAVFYQGLRQADEQAWFAAAQAAERQQQAAVRPAAQQQRSAPSAPPPAGDVADIVRQFFPENFDSAWRVSDCESGHNPGAISPGGGNYGLFQINYVHADDFENVTGQPWESGRLSAYYNTMYARKLYNGEGWGPWSCSWAA